VHATDTSGLAIVLWHSPRHRGHRIGCIFSHKWQSPRIKTSVTSLTRKPSYRQGRHATAYTGMLQYWLSRSSNVDYLHLIWKGVCDFLLVINSNFGLNSHCFWNTATYSLKLSDGTITNPLRLTI